MVFSLDVPEYDAIFKDSDDEDETEGDENDEGQANGVNANESDEDGDSNSASKRRRYFNFSPLNAVVIFKLKAARKSSLIFLYSCLFRFDESAILKRSERRIWEEKRTRILFEYQQFSDYGSSTALLMYELAWKMSRDTNDLVCKNCMVQI